MNFPEYLRLSSIRSDDQFLIWLSRIVEAQGYVLSARPSLFLRCNHYFMLLPVSIPDSFPRTSWLARDWFGFFDDFGGTEQHRWTGACVGVSSHGNRGYEVPRVNAYWLFASRAVPRSRVSSSDHPLCVSFFLFLSFPPLASLHRSHSCNPILSFFLKLAP
jgi:hypothetical protein